MQDLRSSAGLSQCPRESLQASHRESGCYLGTGVGPRSASRLLLPSLLFGNYHSILGLYRDNGQENGNYHSILGLYRDNGKENGNYYGITTFLLAL